MSARYRCGHEITPDVISDGEVIRCPVCREPAVTFDGILSVSTKAPDEVGLWWFNFRSGEWKRSE